MMKKRIVVIFVSVLAVFFDGISLFESGSYLVLV